MQDDILSFCWLAGKLKRAGGIGAINWLYPEQHKYVYQALLKIIPRGEVNKILAHASDLAGDHIATSAKVGPILLNWFRKRLPLLQYYTSCFEAKLMYNTLLEVGSEEAAIWAYRIRELHTERCNYCSRE